MKVAFTILLIKTMITKEQYVEILDTCERYIKLRTEMFKEPMSDDFQEGMLRVLDLIKPLVKKD